MISQGLFTALLLEIFLVGLYGVIFNDVFLLAKLTCRKGIAERSGLFQYGFNLFPPSLRFSSSAPLASLFRPSFSVKHRIADPLCKEKDRPGVCGQAKVGSVFATEIINYRCKSKPDIIDF